MTGAQDDRFQAALAQILQPLARAMIGQSIPIAQATEMLKQAYVTAALQAETDAATDSRISLLTGIHRKDVKRLRDSDPRPPRRPMLNAAALAVGVWSSDPKFRDTSGKPLPLPRDGEISIDKLVKTARIDLPVSTVVQALLEQGVVTQTDEQAPFVLAEPHLTGDHSKKAKMMAFEKNLTAHLNAAADNLGAESSPHFERGAHFNQLSDASIAKLEDEAQSRLQELLIELNALALTLQDRDEAEQNEAQGRFSVGAYILGTPPKDGGRTND